MSCMTSLCEPIIFSSSYHGLLHRLQVTDLSILSKILCLEHTQNTSEHCDTSTATKATVTTKHRSSSSMLSYKEVGPSLLDSFLVHHTTTSNVYNQSSYFLFLISLSSLFPYHSRSTESHFFNTFVRITTQTSLHIIRYFFA